MAGGRQSNSSDIFVRGTYEKIFDACLKAGNAVGKIKQSSKNLGAITIKTPMKMFPPKNPMTLRVSVIEQEGGCGISCKCEGFDGTVGFGSAGKDIDNFYNMVDRYLE